MLVMILFILLYMALGFVIDLFIYSEKYPHASLSLITHALFTLRLTPYATAITSLVALISLWVAITFDK